ncbi:MAG: helix-turn-helix domain-containing protein [Planctomycetaceae bacterium]
MCQTTAEVLNASRRLRKFHSVASFTAAAAVTCSTPHGVYWLAADHLTAEEPRETLALTGVLLGLLGQIMERLVARPAPLRADLDDAQQIRRLLLARVRDRLSIHQIARESQTSPTRAKALFRAAFGCGIMTYFNQLKIWQAKRMLNDPSLTVDQISNQLGFSSPSYFSRVFLKQTGESPTAYRHANETS